VPLRFAPKRATFRHQANSRGLLDIVDAHPMTCPRELLPPTRHRYREVHCEEVEAPPAPHHRLGSHRRSYWRTVICRICHCRERGDDLLDQSSALLRSHQDQLARIFSQEDLGMLKPRGPLSTALQSKVLLLRRMRIHDIIGGASEERDRVEPISDHVQNYPGTNDQ
jgi:hypothetical protein